MHISYLLAQLTPVKNCVETRWWMAAVSPLGTAVSGQTFFTVSHYGFLYLTEGSEREQMDGVFW